MTCPSVSPVTFLISSKVIRSAQAAHMIQSGLSLDGSGFFTRVTGILDFFSFNRDVLLKGTLQANYRFLLVN